MSAAAVTPLGWTESGPNAGSQKPIALLTRPRLDVRFLLFAMCLAAIPLILRLQPAVQHPASGVMDLPNLELAEVPSPKSAPAVPSPSALVQCPHVVLFAGRRHGSTWFMNNIEHCRYSRAKMFDPKANQRAELWNRNLMPGANLKISGKEAAMYALHNRTVKIMPLTFGYAGEERIREMVKEIARWKIPVIVLRRRLEDSYERLVAAKKTNVWLTNSGGEEERRKSDRTKLERDPEFDAYRRKVEGFFETSMRILKEAGATVDVLWYEKVKEEAVAVVPNNRCYVKNCNRES